MNAAENRPFSFLLLLFFFNFRVGNIFRGVCLAAFQDRVFGLVTHSCVSRARCVQFFLVDFFSYSLCTKSECISIFLFSYAHYSNHHRFFSRTSHFIFSLARFNTSEINVNIRAFQQPTLFSLTRFRFRILYY